MFFILIWVSRFLQVNHEIFPILIRAKQEAKPAVEGTWVTMWESKANCLVRDIFQENKMQKLWLKRP